MNNPACDMYDGAIGVQGVCGSKPSTCIGEVNFTTAKQHCESLGARLCTKEEYEAKESAGYGCLVNTEAVWTGTECAAGKHSTIDIYGSLPYVAWCNATSESDTFVQ